MQRGEPSGAALQQDPLQLSMGGCAHRTVKLESEMTVTPPQSAELNFLRSRVRELERDKAEMAAENQRLRNMLVNEIPGLLSTMWQTLAQSSQDSPLSVATPTGRADADYAAYPHHQPRTNHVSEAGGFSPIGHAHLLSDHAPPGEEDLSGDLSDYGAPLGSAKEEEVPVAELGLGGDMMGEEPLCSQTDMVGAELSRRVSDLHANRHANGHANGHANRHLHYVEVYPGSGVLCDVRSWHAANQAQSPTAMARTLLLGVFDMDTLMNSNLRGGRSRRPAFHPQRSALDPHKINAIFNATLTRFPQARKGVIGTGINSKLSEIRFRFRRANRDPRFQ